MHLLKTERHKSLFLDSLQFLFSTIDWYSEQLIIFTQSGQHSYKDMGCYTVSLKEMESVHVFIFLFSLHCDSTF